MTALVVRARAGDEPALAELISAHLPLIYNYIGRALNGHAEVDDLVQETMIVAIRALPRLRDPDRFRPWLAAIAYRQVQMHLRRQQRTDARRAELPPDVTDPGSDFADRTVAELELSGQRRDLAASARWLGDQDRNVLALWWQEATGQLTRAEVAAVLDLGVKHTGVRIQRMKAQLDAARAVVRALEATPRCADLAELTVGWNGRPEPVWRKRLIRHVDDCPRCQAYRGGLLPPEQLLPGLALLPVAVTTVSLTGGSAAPASIWTALHQLVTGKVAAGVAAAAVALAGGITFAVHYSPAPGPATPPAAGAPPNAAGSPAAGTGVPPSTGPAATTAAPGAAPGPVQADIYVAPDGSDDAAGTLQRPFATLQRAVAAVKPGQTIAMRGGTYRPTEPTDITVSGEPDRRITLTRYGDERPVIDAGAIRADKWAITQRANHWTVQGLDIRNSGSHAYVCESCQYNVFRNLSMHGNAKSGLSLRRDGTVGNQVLDSDFFDNVDRDEHGGSGVGLEIKFGSGAGNIVRGNRAFNNADNGFDLGEFTSAVTLEHNWAYGNGVNRWNIASWQSNANGFRLGGGPAALDAAHRLSHNAAWDNVGHGFASSGNRGAMQLRNNTAYHNGGTGFHLPDGASVLHDNAATGNAAPVTTAAGSTLGGNAWDGGATFRSTDPASAQGPRAADGRLPRTEFLRPRTGAGAAMQAP